MKTKPASFCWPGGRRAAVSLSWDDARPTQVEIGLPILDHYGIKGTFYVLPAGVESRLDLWRRAVDGGHEIGNHTINHPCSGNFAWQTENTMLENYTLDRMELELLQASARLQELLGITPTTFAYCCGQTFVGRGVEVRSYVPLVARHFAVGRGYRAESHNLPGRCDLAQIAGIAFDNMSFAQVRPLVDAALEGGGWLVLVGHDVGNPATQLNTRTSMLHRLCDYLKGKPHIWIDTVAAVGRHIRDCGCPQV